MSLEDSYYMPKTPPGAAGAQVVGSAHSRNTSASSIFSQDSSPDSVVTCMTTPSTSPPNHQHGPALLPKIRTQDVIVEPASAGGPRRHRRVLSNTRNPPGFVPYPVSRPSLQRSVIDTSDCAALVSPISTAPAQGSGTASGLSSPIALTSSTKRRSSGGHSRSSSASSIDEATLSRYGYPTYRQLPKYVSQSQVSPTTPVSPASFTYPTYPQVPSISVPRPIQVPLAVQPSYAVVPSPQYEYLHSYSALPSPVVQVAPSVDSQSCTTLLSYLTSPTQAINLVRNVSIVPTNGLQDYFWWDIRNLRSWSSFSLSTFNDISGLTKLLKTPIPAHLTPQTMVPSSRLSPESENALISLINDIYAPRVNAALAVSQGRDHLRLYPAPDAHTSASRNRGGAHFLANYASDTERTSSGSPRGRVVGIVKSFDRWNTGMRNEPPHRRVEYLRGLAHLQRCMREHSCRYGFIMTEIELVCVRAGCDEGDDVPYFGFLELASPIATKESSATFNVEAVKSAEAVATADSSEPPHSPGSSDDSSSRSASPPTASCPENASEGLNVPMTATLGLYFLLMLSKAVPLPSQPSGHLNVGGPGALTRQRILPEPKDKWIPEPQTAEKRVAKRVRGWVWPQDAWDRREGARPKSAAMRARAKQWHK
ncbi:hypothetical protein T310_7450 [Rasamsonia emersonii CBS 393.64]|uniref:Sialidase n=1 Tax=Rasamsonia emersonii (strain ATCC 16479 / CBS 393.64 / IMI 116815) TaxID=1408163 RepID=A0A0F4YL47_RASE3|nr:hypothetical protein T310_7450 [Rasamsonia emersonii CBS 393.64]KKA18591.1 hypothetical protein T310_7450 [Rasamsonia emersonii CBS 393.64]